MQMHSIDTLRRKVSAEKESFRIAIEAEVRQEPEYAGLGSDVADAVLGYFDRITSLLEKGDFSRETYLSVVEGFKKIVLENRVNGQPHPLVLQAVRSTWNAVGAHLRQVTPSSEAAAAK